MCLQRWSFLCFSILDKISSTNPRVIDDARARQLCSDVRRCTYYETCATYGLNVNRVFNDGMCSFFKCHDHPCDGSSFLFLNVCVLFIFFIAAQKIMTAKKQAAVLASCRSLPNSPSHSGGSTPVSGVFPGQVRHLWTFASYCFKDMFQIYFYICSCVCFIF